MVYIYINEDNSIWVDNNIIDMYRNIRRGIRDIEYIRVVRCRERINKGDI